MKPPPPIGSAARPSMVPRHNLLSIITWRAYYYADHIIHARVVYSSEEVKAGGRRCTKINYCRVIIVE